MRVNNYLFFLLPVLTACTNKATSVARELPVESPTKTVPKQWNETKEPNPSREDYLRQNIVSLAEEEFPDNIGLEWNIIGFMHKEHLTYVEVVPNSDTVGYAQFQFVVSFENKSPTMVIATYCFEEGKYSLFSTINDMKEELPKVLP